MITEADLKEAVRYVDARAEEMGDLAHYWTGRVEMSGFEHVAKQRALRACMLMAGQDPQALDRRTPTIIDLPDEIAQLQPILTAIWMDGFAGGWEAKP